MARKRTLDQVDVDLTALLNEQLNDLVSIIMQDLPTYSPQYTGFFASSWKASLSRPAPRDKVEKFSPWNQLKKDKTRAYFKAGGGGAGRAAAKQLQPVVAPRFSTPTFKITDSIFIGNTAEYARYALLRDVENHGSRLTTYIQGDVKGVIDFVFGDKRPGIRIAGSYRGSADSPSSVKYFQP